MPYHGITRLMQNNLNLLFLPSSPFQLVTYWENFESIVQQELVFLRNQDESGVDPDFMKKIDNEIWILDDACADFSQPVTSFVRKSYIPCQIKDCAKHFISKTLNIGYRFARANDDSGVPDFYTYDIKTYYPYITDPSHKFPKLFKTDGNDGLDYRRFAKKINDGYSRQAKPKTITEFMISMHINDSEIHHFSNDDLFFKSLTDDSTFGDDVIGLQLVRQFFNYMVMHKVNVGFIASDSHIRFICRPQDTTFHSNGTHGGHILLTKAYPRNLSRATKEYQSSMLGYLISIISALVKDTVLHHEFFSKDIRHQKFNQTHWVADANNGQKNLFSKEHNIYLEYQQNKDFLDKSKPNFYDQDIKVAKCPQCNNIRRHERAKLFNNYNQDYSDTYKPKKKEKYPDISALTEIADIHTSNDYVVYDEINNKFISQNQIFIYDDDDDRYVSCHNTCICESTAVVTDFDSKLSSINNSHASSFSNDSNFSMLTSEIDNDLGNDSLCVTHDNFLTEYDWNFKLKNKSVKYPSFKFAHSTNLREPVISSKNIMKVFSRYNHVPDIDKKSNSAILDLRELNNFKIHTPIELKDKKFVSCSDDIIQPIVVCQLDYTCYNKSLLTYDIFELKPMYLSTFFPRKKFGLQGKVVETIVTFMTRPKIFSDDKWHDMCSHEPYTRNQDYVPGKFAVKFEDEAGNYSYETYNVIIKRCEYSHSLQGALNRDSMHHEVKIYQFLDTWARDESISPKFYAYGDVWNTHKMLVMSPWGRPLKPLDLTSLTMQKIRDCLKRLHKYNFLLGAFALEVFGIGPDGSIRIIDFRYVQSVKQMKESYCQKDLAQLEVLFNKYNHVPQVNLHINPPILPEILAPPSDCIVLFISNVVHQAVNIFRRNKTKQEKVFQK